MNFQERFKGKTSQMSKDPITSITETTQKMKVDFNNMKPCDVFEITRSYTPKVKSEVGVPTRNSHNLQTLSTTDKGVFRKPNKTMSTKVLHKQDTQNSLASEINHTQANSMFSAIQSNFDNNDTISDIFSPLNLKKSLVMKQIDRRKVQETPAILKLASPQYGENPPNQQTKMEKSISVFQQKQQMQSPQQILQARLAKDRSSSNNFQRVGSYLTKTPQQQNEACPNIEPLILSEITPKNKNKRMQTEEETLSRNMSKFESFKNNLSMQNNTRQKIIEKSLIFSNQSYIRQQTDNGYNVQINHNAQQYQQSLSNSPKKQSNQNYQAKPSLQLRQNQQEEYFQHSNFPSGRSIDLPLSLQLQNSDSNSTKRIRSNIDFYNGRNRMITAQDDKEQDVFEDLGQFINGLNRNPSSYSSSLLQTNNINSNTSRMTSSKRLWMNSQLQQIIPTDSIQNQINQIQMKREEEEALLSYKNSFNYKQRKSFNLLGNDTSTPIQVINSPTTYQRYSENFQGNNEKGLNTFQNRLFNNISQGNTPSNINTLRQKSFSSQQSYPMSSQKIAVNIK